MVSDGFRICQESGIIKVYQVHFYFPQGGAPWLCFLLATTLSIELSCSLGLIKPSLLVNNPGSPEFWGFPPIVVRPRQLANNSINTRPKYYSPLLSSTSAFYWDNFQCSLRFLSFLCFFLMFIHPADSTADAALQNFTPRWCKKNARTSSNIDSHHWSCLKKKWVFSIPPRPLMVKFQWITKVWIFLNVNG